MNDIELKRCPCCGGEATLVVAGISNKAVYIECQKCLLRTPVKKVDILYCTADEVAKIWNRRVENERY